MLLQAEATRVLSQIAAAIQTPAIRESQLHVLTADYIQAMYTGQGLDLAARRDRAFEPWMLDRYRAIVVNITGSHVRFGLECGQLLAGYDPDTELSSAAEAIGIVRQVRDDFDDYFDDHHEPFGDFVGGLNRLPELLFKQEGGNRDDVTRLLALGKHGDARQAVLTDGIRRKIHAYCEAELSRAACRAARDLRFVEADIDGILLRK
jgi:geranylgeranyl pyrophosphate synthase